MSRTSAADGADRSQVGAPTGALGLSWLSQVRAVYQPVVELDTLAVVGFEALARGVPASELESPAALFAQARSQGVLVELDWACRLAALRGALGVGSLGWLGLLVNVEPAALEAPPPPGAHHLLEQVDAELPVVLEVTERALLDDPASLLRGAELARARGWRIAVDDVGADRASLALLPFLRPDVIKLDLRLVQAHTTVDVAEIVTAVNAQAERTGALVLAEGIETEQHRELARAMGATLGQGWLFGRPGQLPAGTPTVSSQVPDGFRAVQAVPVSSGPASAATGRRTAERDGTWPDTPMGLELLPPSVFRRATKPLLMAVSRQLERQALSIGESAVVMATFERSAYFTPTTGRRYAGLGAGCGFAVAFGGGLGAAGPLAPGLRGVGLQPDDPLALEWDVVVVGPHFAGALFAQDLGDSGPDDTRRFDYAVTYDREVVLAAATALLHRVPAAGVPDRATGEPELQTRRDVRDRRLALAGAPKVPGFGARDPADLQAVLAAAASRAPYGVCLADASHPELPLVWVNEAFETLTGYALDEVAGRNCRFLQGPLTDPEIVRRMRGQLEGGRAAHAVLLNYRHDGATFWNDLHLVPVHDLAGAVTSYVGLLHDVTEQVDTQQRAHHLASHDSLTGLANRAQLRTHLAAEIARAERAGTAVAVLYLDLDHFKEVNDTYGHAAGDQLLGIVAARLHGVSRTGDLVARLGGDEFLVVVAGLHEHPEDVALRRAQAVLDALSTPLSLTLPGLPSRSVRIHASIGISTYPADAASVDALLDHADRAMYAAKAGGRQRAGLWRPGARPPAG